MPLRRCLVLCVILALAACGAPSAGPQVATGGSQAAQAGGQPAPAADEHERRQQFESCMRAEGVELASHGEDRNAPSTAGPGADRMAAALEKCRIYLAAGGVPGQMSQQDIEKARAYAKCVRENGVPYYPDPNPQTGQPALTTELGDRLKADPQLPAAAEKCRNLLPNTGNGGGGVLG